jgi:hypothetical protein
MPFGIVTVHSEYVDLNTVLDLMSLHFNILSEAVLFAR